MELSPEFEDDSRREAALESKSHAKLLCPVLGWIDIDIYDA